MSLLLVAWVARVEQRTIEYLREENRVLRERIGKDKLRLSDTQRIRLAIKAQALGWSRLKEICTIVTPGTLFRWYRELVKAKYTSHRRGRPGGRPPVAEEIEQLVVEVARDNRTWGYGRIVGALANLGHPVSKTSVARILKRHGVLPAPDRGQGMSWSNFLRTHAVAAADFFTVEVLTLRGLLRYHVLFVIELSTRRVHLAGLRHAPDGPWTAQVARNLCDFEDGFLRDQTHLIVDRDPLFCGTFREVLQTSGVALVRLPPRSPNLNAYAERFVRSIKQECLSRVIPLGERHLRRTIKDYLEHYHGERNHQGLNGELIDPPPDFGPAEGKVLLKVRLGGLLHHRVREAA